jgi:hypothetical protein
MLVYNIKRSVNILGMSDLLPNSKMELYKAKACFVFITIWLYKDSIKNELQFAKRLQ